MTALLSPGQAVPVRSLIQQARREKTTFDSSDFRNTLARKPWIVPIPGARKLERLDENVGAAAIELMSDDLGSIEGAASKIAVQGARYPEHLEKMTGR